MKFNIKNNYLYLLLIFISLGELYSQPKRIDSLIKEYNIYFVNSSPAQGDSYLLGLLNDLINAYRTENPRLAIEYAYKAIEYGKSCPNSHFKWESYNRLGNIYYDQLLYENALENYNLSLKLSEEFGEVGAICYAYNDIGFVYYKLKLYDLAVKNYRLGLDGFSKINNLKGIAHTYNNMGMAYRNRNSFDTALFYFYKGYEIRRGLKIKNLEIQSLNYIGSVYDMKNDINKSMEYYKMAANLVSDQTIDESDFKAFSYIHIANSFLKLKSLDSALYYEKLAEDRFIKFKNRSNILTCYLLKTLILIEKKEIDEALKLALGSLELADGFNYNSEKLDLLQEISDIYKLKKDYPNYITYLEKHKALDSINNFESLNQTIFNVETANEIKNKDLKIKLLTQLELSSRNLVIFFIIGSILLISIIILFFFQYQQKKKSNDNLNELNLKLLSSEENLKELNSTKDKFFGIIAHDLRGPISSFSKMIELINQYYNDMNDEEKKNLLIQIENSSQNIYNLLDNLLTWSNSQSNKLQIQSGQYNLYYVLKQNVELLEIIANKKNITLSLNLNQICNAYFDIQTISTVFRNLISNSIKFTNDGGKIEIFEDSNNNEFVTIAIKDNGIGMSETNLEKLFKIDIHYSTPGTQNEKGTGLGLILCSEFIQKNNGKIRVESKLGEGSTFYVSIPKNPD